jgi:hypothetical protein
MRTNQNSRQGVTLLFTISMIVLFLLMGTTFVVVANDYYKTARRRSGISQFKVETASLLDRAFYDVLRGPSLSDENSSLRTMSILEDQYGYGYSATASSGADGAADGLKLITIDDLTSVVEIRDGSTAYDFDTTTGDYADGVFGGCVLSVVSGDARGYSGRIVSTYLTGGGSLQLVVPTDPAIDLNSIDDGDRILINGRDFAGLGAGNIAGGALVFDDVTGLPTKLGDGILTPNRKGQPIDTILTGDLANGIEAYIPFNNSPNEPYDIADENNWFLAGKDIDGNIIPSFHRDRLYEDGLANIGRTPDDIRTFSFRPIYIDDEATTSSAQIANSTAAGTSRFGDFYEQDDPNSPPMYFKGDLVNGRNDDEGLDVDSDGDGDDDAVWIDIGLPTQTDREGRAFKPLVAYYIVDMDSRLNLNAHGSYADQLLGTSAGDRRGGSYGVAEVSLSGVVGATDYMELLNFRSGSDDLASVAGNPNNSFRAAQTLFGYVDHGLNTGNLFASGADVFGKNVVGRDVSVYGEESIQGFTTYGDLSTSTSAGSISYAADLGVGGGLGDSLFQSSEMEALLREDDIDSSLLFSRLVDLGDLSDHIDEITTDSAEIAMPPFSVVELLRGESVDLDQYRSFIAQGYLSEEMLMGGLYDLNQPTGNGVDDDGDGIVDEPDELGTAQQTIQVGNPTIDLDNMGDGATGDFLVRQRKANQLYILALLVTENTVPTFASEFGTVAPDNLHKFRTGIAQWAVNIVDFIDSDSIMTAFEFDLDPFNAITIDGDPTTDDSATEGFIVFGAERPELLITETFATHDRRNQDLDTDGSDMAGGDDDWDSGHMPESSVFIELYNPWTQLDAFNAPRLGASADNASQVPPAELYLSQARGSDQFYGVELQRTVGDSPVWRIGVKRTEADAAFLRAIYFAEIDSSTPADAKLAGDSDNYYPSGSADLQVVEPGGYFVVGSAGNVGNGVTSFGRLSIGEDVPNTRRIALNGSVTPNTVNMFDPGNPRITPAECGVAIIDQAFSDTNGTQTRSLSLSTPNGGYIVDPAIMTPENDGTLLNPAIDRPLDALAGPGRDDADLADIWTNGVSDGFRFVYLQRLADPTSPFNALYNPYITIDAAEVDLVAFNGLDNNPSNSDTTEVGAGPSNFLNTTNITASTAMASSERGEDRDNLDDATRDFHQTRRTFFQTADRESDFVNRNAPSTDQADHNFNFGFYDDATGELLASLGHRNNSIGGPLPAAVARPEPLGDLVWLNRPLANAMELVHVPIFPNGGIGAQRSLTLLDHFNRCRSIDEIEALDAATSTPQEIFAYYFGDDKFGHLMGFGGMSPAAGSSGEPGSASTTPVRRAPTQANRFDLIFDVAHVPSKFQGLRTWLDASDTAGFTATPAMAVDGMFFNLRAPYHSLPSFREPGKINLNSLTEGDVLTALEGGFSSRTAGYTAFEAVRDTPNSDNSSVSDFLGRYLPASRAQFVHENARSNAQAGLFRRDGALRSFDFESSDDAFNTETSSWYENEYRQRLGSVATTRSSVFSIWITIGYFEVDEYGRIGAEIGEAEGNVRRNRAFYMVDRSIPVACEPGKNHNVDKAILVRSIIE